MTKTMKLFFATSNLNKLREAQSILGVSIEQIEIDVPEIQSLDVDEVVQAKATAAYHGTNKVVIFSTILQALQRVVFELIRTK